MKLLKTFLLLPIFAAFIALSSSSFADHSWGSYHWASSVPNPNSAFTVLIPLTILDSMTSEWDTELGAAINGEFDGELKNGWDDSPVLDLTLVNSDDSNKTRKRCKAPNGQIRTCNADYGFNGWLGLATIGIDSNGHIIYGTAKMNDSYSSSWAIPGEKQHVVCQEIGHLFGLGHTSEDGSSQGTCMDYSTHPLSQWPNDHDLNQLLIIYDHLDTYDSFAGGGGTGDSDGCNAPPGKGCNKAGANGPAGEIPPMGVRIRGNDKFELWVAPRQGGGLWIHHIRLAPDE